MEATLTLHLPKDFLQACRLVNAAPEEVLQLLAGSISARATFSEETGEGTGAMAAGVMRAFVLQLTASRPMPTTPGERKALHLRHARHLLGLIGSGVPAHDTRFSRAVEAWHRDMARTKNREP